MKRIAALVVATLVFTACGGDDRDEATIPSSPVGRQLEWVLDHLVEGNTDVGRDEIEDRFAPAFLEEVLPADVLAGLFEQTVAEHGDAALTGHLFEPRRTSAAALVSTTGGLDAVIYLDVETDSPHRITGLSIESAPRRPLEMEGRYSGMFSVDGRDLFLSCVGDGRPTVLLVGGVVADWIDVQSSLSEHTRVCAYDKPNTNGSRSEPAPTPRDAAGMATELRDLVDAANLRGPFVVVGHSNGGMVAQLFASANPGRTEGIVLVDSAHEDQDLVAAEIVRAAYPPAQAEAQIEAMTAMSSPIVDPEQLDVSSSREQLRRSRTEAPLPDVPLVVLVHGRPTELLPPELAEPFEPEWLELQQRVADLVPRGRLERVEGAGHDIHQERPEVVVDAVVDVLDQVR